MRPTVYLETSFISYLASRPSRDLIVAANQQISQEWWQTCRPRFDVFVSQLVLQETSSGDPALAQQRLNILPGIPLLELKPEALILAEALVDRGPIPRKAVEDALHLAVATVNGMDYLLTWNYKHLANATMRFQIEQACRQNGYQPPVICAPVELMEDCP